MNCYCIAVSLLLLCYHSATTLLPLAHSLRFICSSKEIFQCELNLPGARARLDRGAEGRGLEDAHRDGELRAVPEVEDLDAQRDRLLPAQPDILQKSKIGLMKCVGAKSVSSDSARFANRRQQVERREVEALRAKAFDIRTRRPMPIDVDGELGAETPGRFEVVPRALEVFTAESAPA